MIRGIHHACLTVKDMELMLGFYRDVMGFEEAAQMGWAAPAPMVDEILGLQDSAAEVRILRAGNAFFELIAYASPAGREPDPTHPVTDCGVRHVAFDVVDVDAEYERLTAAGIAFNSPPVEVAIDGHAHKTCYFRDPEGNVMELQELLAPGNPMALPGT